MLLLLVAAVAGSTPPKQHIIKLDYAHGVCVADFNGHRLPSKNGYPDASGIRSDGGTINIRGSVAIPYKCVGGVIYMLQAAGFKTIHFDAAPSDRGGAPAGAQNHR